MTSVYDGQPLPASNTNLSQSWYFCFLGSIFAGQKEAPELLHSDNDTSFTSPQVYRGDFPDFIKQINTVDQGCDCNFTSIWVKMVLLF